MVKVIANSLYRVGGGAHLYVRNDMSVGFGWSAEDAKSSKANHKHWIKEGGAFNDGLVLIKTYETTLENK